MARQDSLEGRWEKLLRRLGLSIQEMERHAVNGQDLSPELIDIRFKLDADNRTSVLVVLKAIEEGEQLVAFTGGVDLSSAVIATAKKLKAGALKWREDRPWTG